MTPTLTRIESTDSPVREGEAALSNQAHRRAPQLLQELADGLDYLLAQLAQSERESADLKVSNAALDELVGEQQKALVVSMEMMRRLEAQVETLNNRVDGLAETTSSVVEGTDPLRERIAELEKLLSEKHGAAPNQPALVEVEALVSLRQRIAELEGQLAQRSNQVEELTGLLSKARPDPGQALSVLEQQRDQARADLALQSAEMETKEALIKTLELALEKQHSALRTLEERFAEYASRLQELRLDRLKLTAPPSRVAQEQSRNSLASLAKRAFSRPKALPEPETAGVKEGPRA